MNTQLIIRLALLTALVAISSEIRDEMMGCRVAPAKKEEIPCCP